MKLKLSNRVIMQGKDFRNITEKHLAGGIPQRTPTYSKNTTNSNISPKHNYINTIKTNCTYHGYAIVEKYPT